MSALSNFFFRKRGAQVTPLLMSLLNINFCLSKTIQYKISAKLEKVRGTLHRSHPSMHIVYREAKLLSQNELLSSKNVKVCVLGGSVILIKDKVSLSEFIYFSSIHIIYTGRLIVHNSQFHNST